MKKFLSILLIMCVMLTQMSIISFADDTVSFTHYSQVKEWFDSQVGKTGEAALDVSGGIVMRAGGDYVTYNVENLEGYYDVSIGYFYNSTIHGIANVYVGDGTNWKRYIKTDLPATESSATKAAGVVYIGKDDTRIKIESGSYNTYIMTSVTLTKKAEAKVAPTYKYWSNDFTYSLKSNEAKTNNSVYRTKNVDFYSVNGATEYDSFASNTATGQDSVYQIVANQTTSIFRGWFRYDVKGLLPGTYKLTMSSSSPVAVNLKVSVDSKECKDLNQLTNKGGYSNYPEEDEFVGNIYIPENAEYLKIEADNSLYCKYFNLEYLDSKNLTLKNEAKSFTNHSQVKEWFDSQAGKTGEAALEVSGGIVMRAGGDYVTYDVTDLVGYYDVSIGYFYNSTVQGIVNVYVGDGTNWKRYIKTDLPVTEAATTKAAGAIYIGEKDTRIKVESGSYNGYIMTALNITPKADEQIAPTYKIWANDFTYTLKPNDANTNSSVYRTKNVDFYSVNGATEYDSFASNTSTGQDPVYQIVPNQSSAIFRGWFRYDVKGFVPGTYKLTMKSSSPAAVNLKVSVDSKEFKGLNQLTNKGGYSNYPETDEVVGNIYIPENAEYLKIEADNSLYCKYFNLEYVSDENLTLYDNLTIQAEDIADKTANGHDVWFHDTSGNNVLESSSTDVTLRENGEWLKYEIENMKPGAYLLKSYSKNAGGGAFTVEYDDKVIKTNAPLTPSSGYYNTLEESSLCRVYIDDSGKHTLKVINSGTYAQFLDKLTLTPFVGTDEFTISPKGYESYYDAGGEDRFEISGSSVVLRAGDTVTYDASMLGEGIYEFIVYGTNQADTYMNVYFNDEKVIESAGLNNLFNDAGSNYYTVRVNHFLGYFDTTGSQQQMQIKIEGVGGAATMVDSIIIKKADTLINKRIVSSKTGNKGANEIQWLSSFLGENESGKVYGVVELANNTQESKTYDIYVASYRGNALAGCNFAKSVTCPKGETKVSEFVEVDAFAGGKVKVFVFENNSIIPVCEEFELSK